MKLTPAKLKGRIKSLAQKNHADARILLRIFMMERFLERISVSDARHHFIIKGGILVTSMIGVALRSTMDIDASIKNTELSEKHLLQMLERISSIDLDDGITFRVKRAEPIMDEMEYPGIRIAMEAALRPLLVPLKLDLSTGDVITPHEIQYHYKLLTEDRTIPLLSYNLETVLAEKLQTVLARGVLNTRMRDFYDIHVLRRLYGNTIDLPTLRAAFLATCHKRGTEQLMPGRESILRTLREDMTLQKLWSSYQKKFSYAMDSNYLEILQSTESLYTCISQADELPPSDSISAATLQTMDQSIKNFNEGNVSAPIHPEI